MEDHLRNKDRLMKEWEALCSYQAEPSTVSVAQSEGNIKKNRCPDSVPCESSQLTQTAQVLLNLSADAYSHCCSSDDHSRVKLKVEINPSRSDYINASTIVSWLIN